MALREGVENEELNSILKSLAERGKDGEIYKQYNDYFSGQNLPEFSSQPNKGPFDNSHIIFRAYGSAAENLQCYDACDAGDIDFMIFSNSDDLIIHEEMLEYSLENPLHVKIKGSDHPALKSCLVKDTEYVATSALKNFHPSIFGPMSLLIVDIVSFFSQVLSVDEPPHHFTANLINNVTSPAVTLNMIHSLGTISKYREMLKVDSLNAPINEAAAEAECLIHFYCTSRGIVYSRAQAHLLNDILLLIRDVFKFISRFALFFFAPEIFARLLKLLGRLRDINSRSLNMNETEHTSDQHIFTQFMCNQKDSAGNVVEYSGETLPSKHIIRATDAPQNCVVDRRSLEDLEFTSSQSKMPRDSSKRYHEPSKHPVPKEAAERKGVVGKITDPKMSEDYCEHENELQGIPPSKDEKDKMELERRFQRFFTIIFATESEKMEREYTDTGPVTSGVDFIPSFRLCAWPKIAEEWVQRERKWPSYDTVDKVTKEGCHLVVKSAYNGNPECDFRISFSNAEYLLSQELNEIQRECYRCLKRYHRAYLCTKPKTLVSFHLKNIFLQMIEETGAEMWTERNRGDCMMKLLENLLEALKKKDLPHFFVRSYNLFGVDYIENPEILESLARKVEEIMENPVRFAKKLMQNQEETSSVKKEKCNSKKTIPRSKPSLSGQTVAGKGYAEIDKAPSKDSCNTQSKKEKLKFPLCPTEVTEECCPVYRYHDLQDIYFEVTQQLVDAVFEVTDCKPVAIGPLEASLVEDLRDLARKYEIPVGVYPRVFNTFWYKRAYYWVWMSTEPDLRHRVLVAVKGLAQLLKYYLCQAENEETIEVLLDRMFHPCAFFPSHLNDVLPSSNFVRMLDKGFKMFNPLTWLNLDNVQNGFSEEDLREFIWKWPLSSEPCFQEMLELCLRFRISKEPAILHRMCSVFHGILESMLRCLSKKDFRQKAFVDICDRLLAFIISTIPSPAEQEVANNADDIPLD